MKLGNLSDKQRIALRDSTARLNFWTGSVRSGKSFSALIRFMQLCTDKTIEGDFVIIGKTEGALKRNVISEMQNLVGDDCKYSIGNREIMLYNRKIHVIGANDDRAEGKIRGSSFGGALVDEVTLIPENFFTMLLSRLSKKGAKLLSTTNPENPKHWFKVNYIDRAEELNAKVFEFYLDDNPSLEEDYKESLKKEFTGLYYDRFILGKWVLAEGTVYDFFDENLHCIPKPPAQGNFYTVGVDYGTTNPTSFIMIGYNPLVYPNCWIEKEYYYSSRTTMRQKTDSEYAKDLIEFVNGFYVKSINIDPSAASFKYECFSIGIRNIVDADNSVLDGIRLVADYIQNGTLKVCNSCTNSIHEFQSYTWDDKAAQRGVEKPNKDNDHCFTAGTKITTENGLINIEDIVAGDKVLTRYGYQDVLLTHKHQADVINYDILGKRFSSTDGHRFYTLNRGFVEIKDLMRYDILLINKEEMDLCNQKNKYSTKLSIEDIQNQRTYRIEHILDADKVTRNKDMDISIEMFGDSITEKYQKGLMFITSTKIPQTMKLVTLNCLEQRNIKEFIKTILLKNKYKLEENGLIKLDLLQKNGTKAKRVKNGIKNNIKHLLEKSLKKYISANIVETITKQTKKQQAVFVRINVNLHGEERLELITSLEDVLYVINDISQTNIIKQRHVQSNAQIKSVEVYNLTINNYPEFFANGILVHNCLDALRYGLKSLDSTIKGIKVNNTESSFTAMNQRHLSRV